MTKLREPDSLEDAAMIAAAIMGPDECGRIAGGVTGSAVRNWTDPDRDGRPTLHQALKIDVACYSHPAGKGRHPFLTAYAKLLKAATAGAAPCVGSLVAELLDVMPSIGVLTEIIQAACAPSGDGGGAITKPEALAIRQAIQRTRRELDDMETALDVQQQGPGE